MSPLDRGTVAARRNSWLWPPNKRAGEASMTSETCTRRTFGMSDGVGVRGARRRARSARDRQAGLPLRGRKICRRPRRQDHGRDRPTSNTRSRRSKTHPYPIVMIHGGGQNGSNFTGTPDGREGWAQYFLRQGYAVYVVDQVGRGRSPLHPSYGATVLSGDATRSRSDSPRPSAPNCGRRRSCTRSGRGRALLAIRRSISSTPSRCPRSASFPKQQELNRDAGSRAARQDRSRDRA